MEGNWPAEWPEIRTLDDLHIFDPNGDILLQLPEEKPALDVEPVPDEEPAPEEPIPEEPTPEEPIPEQPILEELAPDEELRAQDDTSRVLQSEGGEPLTQTVYLRVSSKHLILASAMFRKMLCADQFSEGQTLHSSGNLMIPLCDDTEALIILMYIVHGMTNSVPRKVTLETLTKLAILVNYYELHEAVGFVSDMWIADLKQKSFPKGFDREVIPWLFISWVFSMRDDYAQLTRILEYESDDRLEDNIDKGLFIPASIISRIQEHRIEAIRRTITIVHDHVTKYLTSDILCSRHRQFDCDAIVLGSLLKGSIGIGIWPRPEVPYCGLTFKNLASKVREMRVLDQCCQDRHYRGYSSGNNHGVMEAIKASIDSLEGQFRGLKLGSFLLETQSNKKSKKNNKGKKKKGMASIGLQPH